MNYHTDVQILNCRSTNPIHRNNEYDIQIYLKDAVSFSFLLEQAHWPQLFDDESYTFSSSPSIPLQLCLLI